MIETGLKVAILNQPQQLRSELAEHSQHLAVGFLFVPGYRWAPGRFLISDINMSS